MDLELAPSFPGFVSSTCFPVFISCELLYTVLVVQCPQEADSSGGFTSENHEKMGVFGCPCHSQQVFYHGGSGRFLWSREQWEITGWADAVKSTEIIHVGLGGLEDTP